MAKQSRKRSTMDHVGSAVVPRAQEGAQGADGLWRCEPEHLTPPVEAGPVEVGMTQRRILVIDDRAEIVAAMQWALSRAGHVVEVAFDAETAIATALATRPDVVLSDIGLPGRSDGLTVARTLRASERFETTYLIAITGASEPEDVKRAVAAGFDLHVSKPVDAHVILRLIAERFDEDAPRGASFTHSNRREQ